MSNELKPCAHCGKNEAVLDKVNKEKYLHPHWVVYCPVCFIGTDEHSLKDTAIGIWNTRAKETEQ